MIKTNIGKHGSSPKEACKDKVPPIKGMHYRKRLGSQVAEIINGRSHRKGAGRHGQEGCLNKSSLGIIRRK